MTSSNAKSRLLKNLFLFMEMKVSSLFDLMEARRLKIKNLATTFQDHVFDV